MNIRQLIEENIEIIKDLRRKLNSNAELSFKEYKTQGIILDFLKELGIDTKVVAGTGVSATLNASDTCIAVRADMDALPVNGVFHACGHAATPHLCKNPIYSAIEFIQSMNIQSRIENNPLDAHVITFASIQCGSADNIIAEECEVSGTVRTFNNELRNKIHQDILKNSN